jgi:hypothetical protein
MNRYLYTGMRFYITVYVEVNFRKNQLQRLPASFASTPQRVIVEISRHYLLHFQSTTCTGKSNPKFENSQRVPVQYQYGILIPVPCIGSSADIPDSGTVGVPTGSRYLYHTRYKVLYLLRLSALYWSS